MTDRKETATAIWQDQHAGKRGHQLMTKRLADAIPARYSNESVADYDTVLAVVKLFSPYSNWTWFITEMDPATGTCFGMAEGFERELGYFDLTELAETTVFGGVPAVERDLYWEPRTIGEIKRGSQGDSTGNSVIREGDTMNDDTGTRVHSQDVVNVEEFLFGGVTEETADDTPAEAAGEHPAGEPTEDAGDLETADGPEDDADANAEELDSANDAGEQPAPAGTETSNELKVVLSIRGNRATIGVQRPSADPHIESFDDPVLFELADEFPAVVARAKAKWEEDPRYPAYVKPAPPARRQRQRQQAATQAIMDEEEAEAERQQPETLQLF